MTSPYMAAVGLPGLEVEQRGLYASLLEEIRGRQLNARSLKVGLVHELSQLVFCPSGNKLISGPKLYQKSIKTNQKSPENHQKITKNHQNSPTTTSNLYQPTNMYIYH